MGYIVLIIYFSFWFLGFLFLFKIPTPKKKRSEDLQYPRTSVIIPARNEEDSLPTLLSSLKKQTLKPDEIIVVDDNSEDATAKVAQKGGAHVLRSKALPEGWQGKPWACWQGAHLAKGDIFVFLDADTSIHPEGFSKIIDTHLDKKGVLSIQPYHKMEKTYEQLSAFFNIIVMAGLNAFTLWGEKIQPSGAFGPCMVIGKDDYFKVGGHEKVKGQVLEDIALGRLYRKEGVPVHCYGGKGAISFRMYPGGVRQLIEGHSKGFAQGAGGISVSALILLILWIAGGAGTTRILIMASVAGNVPILWLACLLYTFYIFQVYWMLTRIGNFSFYTALLFPLALLFFLICFVYSVLLTIVRKKVTWKGRTISINR